MFDWIPLELYSDIYYYILMIIVLLTAVNLNRYKFTSQNNIIINKLLLYVIILLCTLYMGGRPISGRFFGDMYTYDMYFQRIKISGIEAGMLESDSLFYYYMYICTLIMDNHTFFIISSILYFLPILIVSNVNFNRNAFYAVLLLVGSFSFWSYGVNGIRNGLATSMFLLVFATNKKWLQVLIVLIAINLHSSLLIPIVAFLISYIVKRPKYILYGWLICIPISLIMGGSIQTFFAGIIDDDRTSYLTDGNINNDNFSSTGFRWDFLIYSSCAVYAGWYYIFKKNYQDQRYRLIYSTYLIANAFWILVITANFSNRFAYLSWFMMALVIVYPLLKNYVFHKSEKTLAYIIIAYFGFTFLMNVVI